MIKVIRKCFFELCCVLCNIYIEENYEKIFLFMDLEGLKYYYGGVCFRVCKIL